MAEETQGVHYRLTAGDNGFSATLNKAVDTLKTLKNETQALKDKEKELTAELKTVSEKYGENSKRAKELRKSLNDNRAEQARLSVEVAKANNEISKQTKQMRETASAADKATDSTKALANGLNLIKGIVAGYAGKKLFDVLIGTNKDYEQALTSFEVILGSADKADKLMSDLEKFASVTPFNTEDVQKASTMLLGYGVEAENLLDIMGRLGDLSQGSAEKLDRVSLAYGQMLAKGKVTGEEMRQLIEAQVPLLQGLADYLGKSTAEVQDMVSKGSVGINDLNGAIVKMTSEGGKFFNMMEKQSETMGGKLATLEDNISIIGRNIGEETFQALKGELEEVISALDRMSEDGSLDEFAQNIGEDIASVITFIANLIKFLYEIKDVLIAGAGTWLTYKTAIGTLTVIQSVTTWSKGLIVTLKALQAVKANGITYSTLYKAAILGEQGAIKACSAAGIKDIAMKGAQVTATNTATGATLKFNAVLLANPVTWIVGALALLVGGLAAYSMASGNAADKTKKLNEEMSETKDKITETKDKLTEVDKKMAELQKKGTLSLTEQEDLKRLREQKDLLEDELELLREKEKLQNQELNDNAIKYAKSYDRKGWNFFAHNNTDYVATNSNLELYKNANSDTLKQQMKVDLLNTRKTARENLLNITGTDEDAQKAKETLESLIDTIEKAVYSAEELNKVKLTDLLEENNRLSDAVEKLSEKGEVTADDVNALAEKFPALKDYMDSTGVSAETLAAEFSKAKDETSGLKEETSKLSETLSGLSAMGNAIGTLSEGFKEISKDGKLTFSTIAEIGEKFNDVSGIDEYVKRLSKTNLTAKEAQGIFGELTKKYIEQQTASGNLADADEELIAKMLSENGVANASAVAHDVVKSAKIDNAVETVELTDKTIDEIKALSEESDGAFSAEEALQALLQKKLQLNEIKINTADDVAQIENIARAAGASIGTLAELAKAKALLSKDNLSIGDLKQLDNLQLQLRNGTYDFGFSKNSSTTPTVTSKADKKGGGSKSSSKKDDRFEKARNDLQYQLDKELISEEAFYNELEKLNNNFHKQQSEDWKKVDAEIAKGRKKLSEEAEKNAENERKKRVSAFKEENERKLSDIDGYYNRLDAKGELTTEKELAHLQEKRDKYLEFYEAVQNADFLTAEEKDELLREYSEDITDCDKGIRQKKKEVLDDELSDYEAYLDEREFYGKSSAEEEVETYQKCIDKIKEAYAQGILSYEEYVEYMKNYNMKTYTSKNNSFKDGLTSSEKWINERNKLDDWSKHNDTEVEAIVRVMNRIEEAYQNGIIGNKEYNEFMETWGDKLYESVKSSTQKAIEAEEARLKNVYKSEYEEKKKSLEKGLEKRLETLKKERSAMENYYDSEIDKLEELQKKRKEDKEDEDDNLKLARLTEKLKYESDEENRKNLEKEIKDLKEEISDKMFDRDIENQKDALKTEKKLKLEKLDETMDEVQSVTQSRIDAMSKRYERQISSIDLAAAIHDNLDLRRFEEIGEEIGSALATPIQNMVNGALQGINSLNEMTASERGSVTYNTRNVYNNNASVKQYISADRKTPWQIARGLNKTISSVLGTEITQN